MTMILTAFGGIFPESTDGVRTGEFKEAVITLHDLQQSATYTHLATLLTTTPPRPAQFPLWLEQSLLPLNHAFCVRQLRDRWRFQRKQ